MSNNVSEESILTLSLFLLIEEQFILKHKVPDLKFQKHYDFLKKYIMIQSGTIYYIATQLYPTQIHKYQAQPSGIPTSDSRNYQKLKILKTKR